MNRLNEHIYYKSASYNVNGGIIYRLSPANKDLERWLYKWNGKRWIRIEKCGMFVWKQIVEKRDIIDKEEFKEKTDWMSIK